MLPIDTSFDMESFRYEDQYEDPKTSSVSRKIRLKSPKYAMHPPQHPTTNNQTQTQIQQIQQNQPSPFAFVNIRTTSTSPTASVTSHSHEYSSQNNSNHSKNSATSTGSNLGSLGNGSTGSSCEKRIIVSSFSNLATHSIGQGKYRQALDYYQLALQDYLKEETTVVELVNAAATCFNLGALAKKLHDYPQAAEYFDQAQHMYEQSRNLVEQHLRTTTTTNDNSSAGPGTKLSVGKPTPSMSSSSSSSSCQVCLLQLIAETLQARAHLNYKYQSMVNDAIECHEQVIELLKDNSQSSHHCDIYYCRIHFKVISLQSRWQLLVTSLQALGKFYVEKGEIEDSIIAYQDTLSILRKLNDLSIESNGQRQEEIFQILRALSDIFMQTNIESTDVEKLEQSALLQENVYDWEKSIQCWERLLYCQSKKHGEESFEVSVALAQLARVMVLEGNLEGALDLYHASANISLKNKIRDNDCTQSITTTKNILSLKFNIPDEVFTSILNLYNDLDRIADSIGWLKNLLSKSERREDQARIQLELGKLYLSQGLFPAASESLYLSLELFDGEDESAFEFLKKVESLQNQDNNGKCEEISLHGDDNDNDDDDNDDDDGTSNIGNNTDVCMTASRLTAITEEGESGLASASTLLNEDISNDVEKDSTNRSDCNSLSDSLLTKLNAMDDEINPIISVDIDENKEGKNLVVQSSKDITKEIENEEKIKMLEHEHSTGKELTLTTDADALLSIDDSLLDSRSGGFPLENDGLYPNRAETPDLDAGNSHDKEDNENENHSHTKQSSELILIPTIKDEEENKGFTPQSIISGEIDATPETFHSRTGLLNHIEKDTPPISLNIPRISSSPPKNQLRSSGRKGYTEMKNLERQSGATGRRRIVKALSSPFRRSRSKSRSVSGNGLVPVDEDKVVRSLMPVKKPKKIELNNESINCATDAPVSFIDLRNPSDDESLVSQITFRQEELLSKKKETDSHWWWGVTAAEGLVNQAVEAAEGFLSAKAIHDSVKSRPLDFDSDDESDCVDEDLSLLKDTTSKQVKTKNDSDEAADENLLKPVDFSFHSQRESAEPLVVKNVINSSNSESYKIESLECEIKEKELRLKEKKKENGPDDVSVGALLFDLAELYTKAKEFTNAKLYCKQALLIHKSSLNLQQACDSLCLLAEVHCREKQYNEALSCYSEAQRIRETIDGTYFNEEIAHILNQSGDVLSCQGKFDLAMEKHKEALRILKEVCGENAKNPLVSRTLIHIGNIYYKERNSLANIQCNNDGYSTFIEGGMLEVIGRAWEDRGSYRMAIAFFEEKLQFLNDAENSEDLEDVAETLNSLGMLSCRAGMYLEAIDYYDRALSIQMKLGCDDVQLAMARVLAGSVQYSLGHFQKALKLFTDALETLRGAGLAQETVASTLYHIGAVHSALCNYDDAMFNLRDALDIQTKVLGNDHPATFRTRREIGNLFAVYESELEAAFIEYTVIIEAQKRVHGEKHPYVAETLHSIGCAQARKGDLNGALRSLEGCYNMRLQFIGMDHPQQATTLHEIAKIQLKRGRVKKAIHIIDAALHIRVESLSEQHIDVALAMTTKASCLVARGNFVDASNIFLQALHICKSAVGPLHPSVAWIQVQIGVMYLRKCDFESASDVIKKALAIYQQSNLDEDHPGIKEATEELERVERAEMLCV